MGNLSKIYQYENGKLNGYYIHYYDSTGWAQETGNSAVIDVDTTGDEQKGIFDQGTCKPGEDERITITCPQSSKLQVQLCTGG